MHRLGMVALVALAGLGCGGVFGDATLLPTEPTMEVNPKSFELGPVAPGTTRTFLVTLQATGRFDLAVTGVTVLDDKRSAFQIVDAPARVSRGGSADVKVTYTAPGSPGTDAATLVIASDARDAHTTRVPLTATSVVP
jgi:hypothetical protein